VNSVYTSLPEPEKQAGMPPAETFWRALVVAGTINLVVWSVILYLIGPKADEWNLYLFLFSLTFLLTLLGVYRGYSNRNALTEKTPGRHIGSAVFWGLLGAFWIVMAFLERRSSWDVAEKLTLATVYFAKAANDLRKASRPETAKSLSI
jgi:hypothetical protein